MSGTAASIAGALLVVGGVALGLVGGLGWRRRLPRNRFAGVRTVNTLRDEETFAVGNQVGAPLSVAAGAVAALGGVAVLAAHTAAQAVTLTVLAAAGAVVLTLAGGVLGDRAARRVPMPSLGGCTGVCASCALSGDGAEAGPCAQPPRGPDRTNIDEATGMPDADRANG